MTDDCDKCRLCCYECEHCFWDTQKSARKKQEDGSTKIICPKCGGDLFTDAED